MLRSSGTAAPLHLITHSAGCVTCVGWWARRMLLTAPPRALCSSLEEDGPLLRELRRNEKIAFDEADRLFYQPEIDVRDKAALLKKIQVSQRPVQLKTVLDAYPRAEKDLQVCQHMVSESP